MSLPVETEYTFYGNIYSEGCPGCNRIEPQPEGLAIVYDDGMFRVHQDYALPIPGMMVIETNSHVKRITDFTEEMAARYGSVLQLVRGAMEVAGIDEIYEGLEEKSSHFHVWMMPILPWMRTAARDGKTRNAHDIFQYAMENLNTPENHKLVEDRTRIIREHIQNHQLS